MSVLESPFNPMATFDTQTTINSISSLDPKLSRTHYYDGRLLKASDLTRDQFYLDERLREVGRALGQGIVRGLQVTLRSDRKINISPGLAITPSGRVLELEKQEQPLDLMSAANLFELNPGVHSLPAGLYAIEIRYAEKGVGSAEIYPRDLEAERGFHFNAFAEGVQFAVVKLSAPLPTEKMRHLPVEEASIYARALLARQLLVGSPGQHVSLGEDSVALGLIAIEYGIPQWLDVSLLRRPYRRANTRNALQFDLYNHYEELLQSVLQVRSISAHQEQFLASRYFSMLPPVGTIPKGSVDPVNGYQNFFPENFEVSIAPVREDDIASLIEQSLALEPIDFRTDKDVDIMIAVVVDDVSFSYLARQLQHLEKDDSEFIQPPHLDEFFLKHSAAPVNIGDSSTSVWGRLWDSARRVLYLRRPIRAAETQVSAVVLARGDYEALQTASLPSEFSVESLEQEIDGLTALNTTLTSTAEELRQQIAALRAQLDLTDDERLAAANANIAELEEELAQAVSDLAAANTSLEEVSAQLTQAEEKLKEAQEKIDDLSQNGGTTDTEELERLKKALSETTAELRQVQQLINTLWEVEEIKVSKLDFIADLRPPKERGALKSMDVVLNDAREKPESQKYLVPLLALMPSPYDDLNWPTLEFILAKELAEKIRGILLKQEQGNYPELMYTLSQEFEFPEELQAGWGQIAKKRVMISPTSLSTMRAFKVSELLPDSVEISGSNREFLKEKVSADKTLLLQLSQLKVLVGPRYEAVLWQTAPSLIEADKVGEFLDYVVELNSKSLALGVGVAAANTRFKINASARNAWAAVDLG